MQRLTNIPIPDDKDSKPDTLNEIFIFRVLVNRLRTTEPKALASPLKLDRTKAFRELTITLLKKIDFLERANKKECKDHLSKLQLCVAQLHEECPFTFAATFPKRNPDDRIHFYVIHYIKAYQNSETDLIKNACSLKLKEIMKERGLIPLVPFPSHRIQDDKKCEFDISGSGKYFWSYNPEKEDEEFKKQLIAVVSERQPENSKKIEKTTSKSSSAKEFLRKPFIFAGVAAGMYLSGGLGLLASSIGVFGGGALGYAASDVAAKMKERCDRSNSPRC